VIEDWGCGPGFFAALCRAGQCVGIDGSRTPAASIVADLAHYRSSVDGIFIRHVLEHNYCWREILRNALGSFRRRMVLVLFTPFADEVTEIGYSKELGVPDLSLVQSEIEQELAAFGVEWRMESLQTNTQYGVEHIFYIWREDEK